jgi:hypothetical protein
VNRDYRIPRDAVNGSPRFHEGSAKMNIRTSLRREDMALVRAWGRSVYADRERVGVVHPTDSGWLAEDAAGRIVGTFGREQRAVFAVLDAARRA